MRFTVTTRAPLALGAACALAGMGLLAAPAQANTCPEGMAFIEGSTSICEQRFTANGTWTAPAGVTSIEVLVVGGGGGGGGANDAGNAAGNNSAGGGGGGGVLVSAVTVTPGSTYTITVGEGGPGGAKNVNGGPGGTSRFSGPGIAELSRPGGSGGDTGGAGGNSGNGLAGGAGGGETLGAGGGAGAGQAGETRGGGQRGGGFGGNGLAPSSALFTSTTDFYGGGGGGGGMRGLVGADDPGGLRGLGGAGGGVNGGSGNRSDADANATSASGRGGGGGGGGVIQPDRNVAAFLIGAGGSGGPGVVVVRLLVGSAGPTTPAAPTPGATQAPQSSLERVTLDAGNGYSCDVAALIAFPGTWVTVPAAGACRSTPGLNATLLGWATTPTFPVDIAKRQMSNGWGAYQIFDADGALSAVFIPAGGATLISGTNTFYAIWGT